MAANETANSLATTHVTEMRQVLCSAGKGAAGEPPGAVARSASSPGCFGVTGIGGASRALPEREQERPRYSRSAAQASTGEIAVTPPSIRKSAPTTYAESSDAR